MEKSGWPGAVVFKEKLLNSCHAVGFPHGSWQRCCCVVLSGAIEALDVREAAFSDFCASIAVGIARTARARTQDGRITLDATNGSVDPKDYLSAAASLTLSGVYTH
jgi:hypothetical protein